MLDKSSVFVLAEGMYVLDKCISWTKVAIKFQVFGRSTACLKLSKFLSFLKPGVSFCINFAPFCNIFAET